MKKSIVGCVDSISEGIAKIAFEEHEKNVFVPVGLLPSGVKEGSWLSCAFKLEKDAEASSKKKVAELYESLGARGSQKFACRGNDI